MGDYREFYCDKWLLVTEVSTVGHELEKSSFSGVKHLGVVIPTGFLAKSKDSFRELHDFMGGLKAYLERSPPIRRLTVILGNLDEYNRYREVFWEVFPENPHDTNVE